LFPILAGIAVFRMARDRDHVAVMDADRWQDSTGTHTLAQSWLACPVLRDGARPGFWIVPPSGRPASISIWESSSCLARPYAGPNRLRRYCWISSIQPMPRRLIAGTGIEPRWNVRLACPDGRVTFRLNEGSALICRILTGRIRVSECGKLPLPEIPDIARSRPISDISVRSTENPNPAVHSVDFRDHMCLVRGLPMKSRLPSGTPFQRRMS
jgi:hypothetical protein